MWVDRSTDRGTRTGHLGTSSEQLIKSRIGTDRQTNRPAVKELSQILSDGNLRVVRVTSEGSKDHLQLILVLE